MLFDGVGDEDIAACLRLFDRLRERLGCGLVQLADDQVQVFLTLGGGWER